MRPQNSTENIFYRNLCQWMTVEENKRFESLMKEDDDFNGFLFSQVDEKKIKEIDLYFKIN
jgi:hypothetical protein